MRKLRPDRRRRRARPVRVVDAGVVGVEWDAETAHAAFIGLRGAHALARTFPDFYASEGVAALDVTSGTLLGCCAALWHLADERAGFPLLRWPSDGAGGEMTPAETPAETLRCYGFASSDWMTSEVAAHITPQPHYWGWGVESIMEEWEEASDPLAVLLWHLFQHTEWAIGIDIAVACDDLSDEAVATIPGIRVLPADTPVRQLAQHLTIPEATAADVSAAELLAYPFAQCHNELANHTDYEVEAIHFGELDEWSWSQLDELIADAREAMRIEQAYIAWRLRVEKAGAAGLRQVAAAVLRAARAARAEDVEAPRTLLALLGHPLAQINTRATVEAIAAL